MAPVGLTAGSGFRFEDQVAARVLLDMLGAQSSPTGRSRRTVSRPVPRSLSIERNDVSRPQAAASLELARKLGNDVEPAGRGRPGYAGGEGALYGLVDVSGACWVVRRRRNSRLRGVALRRQFQSIFATLRDAWRGRLDRVRSPVAPPDFREKSGPSPLVESDTAAGSSTRSDSESGKR